MSLKKMIVRTYVSIKTLLNIHPRLARTAGSLVLVAALVLSSLSFIPMQKSSAATIQELERKSQQLQKEIENNKREAAEHHSHAESLEGRIGEINEEIAVVNTQVELLSTQIAVLQLQLDETNAELVRQRGVLGNNIKTMYLEGDISTIEILASSNNISDFVDKQQYRTVVQEKIKTTLETINTLKLDLDSKKASVQELLTKQEQQGALLASKKQEQQTLLDQTQGEEARYRALIADQQQQLEAAETELTKLLSSGRFVALGPVSRGGIVGGLGSTGFSTGPHLHFMVKKNGTAVNPGSSCNTLINDYDCPVARSYVSTPFGNVSCNSYPCAPGKSFAFHGGLDLASSYHEPVRAAADGQIVFRGCQGGLGYVVVIDHGGGWQTWYPHMVTPSGQVSGYCG